MRRNGGSAGLTRLTAELGVQRVYMVDMPEWWLRLTAPVSKSWRRELALFVSLLAIGLVAGFALGRL